MNECERTSTEMRCLITCLHLSGTYDQLNSPCVAPMETVARRVAQIVEACCGEGGKPRWAAVHHYEGRTSAMVGTVLTEKELLPAREGGAKDGGLEAWRQRRNDCEPGQWRRDDRWPNQVPERWLRCCVGYHVSVTPDT